MFNSTIETGDPNQFHGNSKQVQDESESGSNAADFFVGKNEQLNPPDQAQIPAHSRINTGETEAIEPDLISNVSRAEERMKVIVRIRPFNDREIQLSDNTESTIQVHSDNETLQVRGNDGKVTVMGFHRIYDIETDQENLFSESGIKAMILRALQGYVTTIFAFGQTGSAITGPFDEFSNIKTKGIVLRALDFMYEEVNKQRGIDFDEVRIQASYLEIYNENVFDLLNPYNSGLQVRWTQERGFFVQNLFIVDCDTVSDCLAVLEEGLRNRTTGSHATNEHSSRSHSVLTLYLELQGVKGSKGMSRRYGKISFVDLAGSEKVKETKASSDALSEALSINKSLLTLGKCISTLADPKTRKGHIPYRDSKLTKLLSDSLDGRGSTLMIACVSPSPHNLNETLKTLRYASQARKIYHKPSIQLGPHEELLLNLRLEIQSLKQENSQYKEILRTDGKYDDLIQSISEQSTESKRQSKSRARSPAPSRNSSSSKTIKSIASHRRVEGEHMRSLSRNGADKNTPRFNTSRNVQKAAHVALPTKSRNSSQTASKNRVDELVKSNAPAGLGLDIPIRSKSRQHKRISSEPEPISSTKASLDIKPRLQTPYLRKPERRTGGEQLRPMAREFTPKMELEPFPPGPRSRGKSNNAVTVYSVPYNSSRHPVLPVSKPQEIISPSLKKKIVVKGETMKAQPMVIQAVADRHQILMEVEDLERAIKDMSQ